MPIKRDTISLFDFLIRLAPNRLLAQLARDLCEVYFGRAVHAARKAVANVIGGFLLLDVHNSSFNKARVTKMLVNFTGCKSYLVLLSCPVF